MGIDCQICELVLKVCGYCLLYTSAKVADTTGAGDTLHGAFAVQIAGGTDMKSALTYANTAASLSTEKFGAQSGMPTAEEVEKELGI